MGSGICRPVFGERYLGDKLIGQVLAGPASTAMAHPLQRGCAHVPRAYVPTSTPRKVALP